MVAFKRHMMLTTIASPIERRNQMAMPSLSSVANSPTNSGGADGMSKGPRILLAIRHPVALIALAVTLVSLIACAGTSSNSFLGPAYDGPTAVYGYNHP